VGTAPDVVLNILKLSETQFAWLFVPIVSGLILGSVLTARTAGHISFKRMARMGVLLMVAAASVNLAYNYFFTPRVPWAVLPLFLHTLGFALFAPVGTILSLDLFPRRRGLASSLQGFMQMLLFALLSGFIARLVYASGFKHSLAMALMMTLNLSGWRYFLKHHPWPAKPVVGVGPVVDLPPA
jgi:DHA1 family bicyclomycin/chloramphenicol resistance-like MFS transporter